MLRFCGTIKNAVYAVTYISFFGSLYIKIKRNILHLNVQTIVNTTKVTKMKDFMYKRENENIFSGFFPVQPTLPKSPKCIFSFLCGCPGGCYESEDAYTFMIKMFVQCTHFHLRYRHQPSPITHLDKPIAKIP